MRPIVNVARLHVLQPVIYLGFPWAITAFSLAVNLVIFGAGAAGSAHRYTGAASITFIFFLLMGVTSLGRTLPFGMSLGASRRTYYLGTALLAVTLAALEGLALTILQAIERGSGGWGIALHFFRVPYILDGPWYLTWLTSFTGLALLFGYGMWLGLVQRRWGLLGSLIFLAAQVTVAVAVVLLITWADGWPATGHFFSTLSAAGLTGLLAVLTAALFGGGYLSIRRVTI
jgi:hypothetical protein